MRLSSLLTISYIYFVFFTNPAFAIVRTEEVVEWTKDSLKSYFDRYKIVYDKAMDQSSLVEIAQAYKDAATANAKYFGNHVDQIVSEFNIDLKKNTHLAQNDVDGFITNLKHQLRQLELKGKLSKEHVKAVLDKAQNEAIRLKLVTEADWKKAYSKIESRYQEPSWYQRVLRIKPEVEDGSSSLNRWLHTISDRISHLGGLTKEEAKHVVDQIRSSIENTDIHRLGDKMWAEDLSGALAEKTQMTKDQIDRIIESIKSDIYGYKIFALEYTGQAKEEAKNWYEYVKYCCEDFWDRIVMAIRRVQNRLHHIFNMKKIKTEIIKEVEKPKQAAQQVTSSIQSVASSLSYDWHSSSKSMARSRTIHSAMSRVSEVATQATNKIQDMDFEDISIKSSFAHFWRQKEHDAYRRLGYAEAHIDWIQNYLYNTFANQKALVRGKTDEAAIAIKRYLNELKIQKPDQVEQNVHKLRSHLEAWRTLVDD
ncbi:hypothetical protein EDC96DRAFT_472044 [Choanephora cucurbitarum]|nr:hypothetical protein EDC96DRAFT_472044 [Choanephora cucurbitarum]